MIVAIDPGDTKSAWCIIDETTCTPLFWNKQDNQDVLTSLESRIWRTVNGDLISVSLNEMAIEMIQSFGMPVGQSVFLTCVWIGRFIEASKLKYTFVYRSEEKIQICQSMKANDSTIRQALIDIYGTPGTKKSPGVLYGMTKDMWSALAVAVTFLKLKGVWTL